MALHPIVVFDRLFYGDNMDIAEAGIAGIDTSGLRAVLPQRLDWPSVIGLFILNFGNLELALVNILKLRSKPESKKAVIKKSFHEKIRCLEHLAESHSSMAEKRAQWKDLIVRMDAIRDLRNHLSHSTLVHSVSEDLKSLKQVLCLTQDVSADAADALRVTFEELFNQNQLMADLLGELVALDYACKGAYEPSDGTVAGQDIWTQRSSDAPESSDT